MKNKKARRVISLIFSIILLISLVAGCGSSQSSKSSNTSASSSKTAASTSASSSSSNGKIRIGLAMSSRDQYFADLQSQIERVASENGNVEIVAEYEADYDVQKQLEQMATLASLNVDVILSSIVDTNNADAVIEKANGIPLILLSRHPETSVLEKYSNVTFVGSPEKDAGMMQGEWLGNYFKEKGVSEVNYVLFMGPLGYENVTLRTEGAKEGLESTGMTLNKVYEDTAEWDRAEAMSKMQQILATGKQIDCVIANNDEMALGAIEALKAAGRLKDIPVVGVDATTAGCTSVKNGEMAMTVLQNAKGQAEKGMEAAMNVLAGKTVDKENWIPFEEVTPENVDQYLTSSSN